MDLHSGQAQARRAAAGAVAAQEAMVIAWALDPGLPAHSSRGPL